MKAIPVKPVRCAIYTRVSTDQGLDQEFNSLDAMAPTKRSKYLQFRDDTSSLASISKQYCRIILYLSGGKYRSTSTSSAAHARWQMSRPMKDLQMALHARGPGRSRYALGSDR